MHASGQSGTLRLLLRCLMPSFGGGVVYVFFAGLFVVVHVLLISLRTGTLLPDLFDGHVSDSYMSYIAAPLNDFLGSVRFDSVMIAVLWGLAGLMAYTLIDQAIKARREWSEAGHDVQFINAQTIVQHPLQKQYVLIILWKLCISLVVVGFVFVVQPALQWIYWADVALASGGASALNLLGRALTALLVWIVIMHLAVVLARLYLLRTRLRG